MLAGAVRWYKRHKSSLRAIGIDLHLQMLSSEYDPAEAPQSLRQAHIPSVVGQGMRTRLARSTPSQSGAAVFVTSNPTFAVDSIPVKRLDFNESPPIGDEWFANPLAEGVGEQRDRQP